MKQQLCVYIYLYLYESGLIPTGLTTLAKVISHISALTKNKFFSLYLTKIKEIKEKSKILMPILC